MKSKLLYAVTFLCLFIGTNDKILAQITRGAQPGEIYISTDWYMDNYGKIHYAIFHSTDNGEHIALKYENIETPPSGEMKIGKVLGDATPGALYNWGWNELWVSYSYGENWVNVENFGSTPKYTTGCIESEIYKCCANVQGTVWRSIDFGNTFEDIREDIKFKLEVGVNPGIVYGLANYSYPEVGFYLNISNDYALNFIEISIDSAVAFWSVSGHYPQISRGTKPGEIFLVSWWPDYHYKIFHSVDTGYTWTEKFESDYINVYYWRVAYTAGREPGSFYVLRSTVAPAGDHIWLYIDYSSDYGETFTTYFHDLDSLYTSLTPIIKPDIKLSAYPTPFSEKTTIVFDLPNNCNAAVLSIYDISGMLIKQYNVYGNKVQQWDGCNSSGATVKSGLYFYQIKTDEYLSPLNKLMFIN
ncbi:MAG: T9SS type A sorting domain-containing protein [Bacteroidales bacterium]|nr:T9SS type A sorting domain-containing protein [Bacteroidales bacterium]